MISKKAGHVDSISVFLQGIKRKRTAQVAKHDVLSVKQTPVAILERLDSASGSLDIESLHGQLADLSMTQLSRLINQLEDAGLVAVDSENDNIRLTDMGRTVSKLPNVITSQSAEP